jgi:hypothetical protein
VANIFIPNTENKPQVNHIKGIKKDNMYWSLEWSTAKENSNHAVKNNLRTSLKGQNHKMSKLTDQNVIDIRLIGGKIKQYEIAKMYNVSIYTISLILLRKTWKHI